MTDSPQMLVENAVLVDESELLPHPQNPRQGDVGAIVESIRANGFYAPLIVQRSTRYVLAGNHRLLAARALGITEVPVVWLEVDDERALRILLADNRTADLAAYDDQALAALLTDLAQQTETGLAGTAWEDFDLDALLADLNTEVHHRRDAVPSSERKEQFDSSPLRQIMLIMDVPTFERALRTLMAIQSAHDELDTNTAAIAWLLDRWAEDNDFDPDEAPHAPGE